MRMALSPPGIEGGLAWPDEGRLGSIDNAIGMELLEMGKTSKPHHVRPRGGIDYQCCLFSAMPMASQ